MSAKSVSLKQRIKVFAVLGNALSEGAAGSSEGLASRFATLVYDAEKTNLWFTPENVTMALKTLGDRLSYDNISFWLSKYPELGLETKALSVGVVMAGNIPMVGFHDLLCVLITGNRIIARLSSKDELLMKCVAETLVEIEPALKDFIEIRTGTISGFDMVIATGSDNTSRYFEYYFRNYPSIIRRNRNSIAVLDGTETEIELRELGRDVFTYFGLGCRNVSKLYLPTGYDVSVFRDAWSDFEPLRGHHKYAVNYDHNKAVMIVNRQSFTDLGYILLSNEKSLTPPMAVLNYEFYESKEWLENEISATKNAIQCIAGHGHTPFGKSQSPELWDYADDVDTILFLSKKNHQR